MKNRRASESTDLKSGFSSLQSPRGFSLIDLLLTCFLIFLLAGLGVPFLHGLAAEQKRMAACDLLVSALAKARALAISRNTPVRLLAEPSGRFALQAGARDSPVVWRQLPAPVRFLKTPRRPVLFHSRGTASPGGSYLLGDEEGSLKVIVSVSGRVRWTRPWGGTP